MDFIVKIKETKEILTILVFAFNKVRRKPMSSLCFFRWNLCCNIVSACSIVCCGRFKQEILVDFFFPITVIFICELICSFSKMFSFPYDIPSLCDLTCHIGCARRI